MKTICYIECGEPGGVCHSDPRTPPLSTNRAALCYPCFYGAAEQVIEELRDQITALEMEMDGPQP